MSGDIPDYLTPVLGPGSVSAVHERRSTILNDSEIEDGTTPDSLYTEETYRGKFFPRGCRGMMEALLIYCKRTGAGEIELRYSPHPSLGPIGTVTVTPGSSWAWKGVAVEKMWSYDSLFIWVYTCDADVSWAYDAEVPVDGHHSDDSGATWEDTAERPFIRATLTGETAGDVPVSGIINNIPIPNIGSIQSGEDQAVSQNVLTEVVEVEGAGYTDLIIVDIKAASESETTVIRVLCDGDVAQSHSYSDLLSLGIHPGSPGIALTQYGEDARCTMVFNKRFEFRRSLVVDALNANGDQTVSGDVYPNLLK